MRKVFADLRLFPFPFRPDQTKEVFIFFPIPFSIFSYFPSSASRVSLRKEKTSNNNIMYSDGHEVDGSWVLRVYVTDLQVERSLRVKGELHIGGVMLRLVEDLGEFIPNFVHSFIYPCEIRQTHGLISINIK